MVIVEWCSFIRCRSVCMVSPMYHASGHPFLQRINSSDAPQRKTTPTSSEDKHGTRRTEYPSSSSTSPEWRNYDIFSGAFNMSSMKTNISPRPSAYPHFLPSNNCTISNRPLSAANYPAFRRTVTTTPHNPATATSARHARSSTRMPSSHVRTPSTRYTVHTLATRPTLST